MLKAITIFAPVAMILSLSVLTTLMMLLLGKTVHFLLAFPLRFALSWSLVLIIWFTLGAALASFAEVVMSRFPQDGFRSSLSGRSFCSYCHHILKPLDLVPIVSYLLLLGRCRYCHQSLPWRYPLGEFLFGLVAVALAWHFRQPLLVGVNLIIVTALYILAGIDALTQLISEPVLVLCAVFVVVDLWLQKSSQSAAVIGLAIPAGLFYLLVTVSRQKWMGAGDIELGAVLGLWLGYPLVLIALLLAYVSGALYGLTLILTHRATAKTAVPFAPFLILAAVASLLWGKNVLQWFYGG